MPPDTLPAVVVFAKKPSPGRVKTRLTPPLTPEQAADFHGASVRDVWNALQTLTVPLYFYADDAWDDYGGLAEPQQRRRQQGIDLGARMFNCFQELQAHNGTLIVGGDSPTLPLDYLRQGLRALDSADIVLGPAEDGGYYAIGCRKPVPGMFDGVSWSSPQTLQQTQSRLRSLGLNVALLPAWYDVDTIEELRRLATEPALPPNVARWIEAHRALLI